MLKDKILPIVPQSVTLSNPEERFLNKVNITTNLINEKIEAYNNESERDKKLIILQQINQARIDLENLYTQSLNVTDFNEKIVVKLFQDCQEECIKLGTSISALNVAPQVISGLDDTPIAKLLSDLDPATINSLLLALSNSDAYL